MSGYLAQNDYFGNSYWGQWYWGAVGVEYHEIFRAVVIMNILIMAASTMNKEINRVSAMNRIIPGKVIMNQDLAGAGTVDQVVSDIYQELEQK